jgi:hypothetical protein
VNITLSLEFHLLFETSIAMEWVFSSFGALQWMLIFTKLLRFHLLGIQILSLFMDAAYYPGMRRIWNKGTIFRSEK